MKISTLLVVGLGIALCAGCTKELPPPVQPVATSLAFFVHLQEGFSGEAVRIGVDGNLVYEGNPTTDYLLGSAHGFAGSAKLTDIVLRIEIPTMKIDSTHKIDLTKAKGMGISVQNGKVTVVQADAFGYD